MTPNIVRIRHEDAIRILKESGESFEFEPEYGEDTAKEHEKYLTEKYFHAPVFIYDWPKDIKAFYMYQNDDGKTVGAVDLLVPGAGELMGGSQREVRYDRLLARMQELGISTDSLDWYLNLRNMAPAPFRLAWALNGWMLEQEWETSGMLSPSTEHYRKLRR